MNATSISPRLRPLSEMPSRAGTRFITVGLNASKQWIVKDNQGRLGGVFRSGKAALRFARDEASTLHCCIIMSNDAVELACLLRS